MRISNKIYVDPSLNKGKKMSYLYTRCFVMLECFKKMSSFSSINRWFKKVGPEIHVRYRWKQCTSKPNTPRRARPCISSNGRKNTH